MFSLVAFIGWVVLRYSATYLDGEARQGAFMGWMALSLAAVMLLVTAGNLGQLVAAWVGVALGLRLVRRGDALLIDNARTARKGRPAAKAVVPLGGRRRRRLRGVIVLRASKASWDWSPATSAAARPLAQCAE